MVVLLVGWVSECCRASLALELLFLSQALKTFLLGYFKDATPCQRGRVAAVVRTGDGGDPSGWGGLMLWWSQR